MSGSGDHHPSIPPPEGRAGVTVGGGLHTVPPAPSRPRVLVVDDNAQFRTVLRELLEDYDIDVVGEGASGFEAVELADHLMPDAVVMDLRMPEMDGIAAARAIKHRRPRIQVIILSAYDDSALRVDARRARVHSYLAKGSDPLLLRDAVMEAWTVKSRMDTDARSPDGPAALPNGRGLGS